MRNDPIYCFVILHYKSIEDTDRCIQSVLQLHDASCARIVVLDNGSDNGTGELLQKKYTNCSQIKIVISDKNLGFSKGNNLAYTIAKSEFHPDYMIVCNSDIIFEQKDTLDLIREISEETGFDVLGPDTYIPAVQFHANPLAQKAMTIAEIEHEIELNEDKLNDIRKACFSDKVQKRRIQLINWGRRILHKERSAAPAMKDVVLQGACYILGSEYIKKQDRIFYPMDSFYFEEYFVFQDCMIKHYKLVYDPRIQVIHNESASTKKDRSDLYERKKFKLTNLIASMKLYCEIYGNED